MVERNVKYDKMKLLDELVLGCCSMWLSGDVAQLVSAWTVTPLTQARFSGAARDFSPSQLSVQTLTCVRTQSHALTSVRTLEIL